MRDVLWITFFSVSFIMKFVKLFVLLLILACILFVILQTQDRICPILEGFDQVPSCQTSATRVPSCYASLQSDDYLDFYSDAQREDYILKTQIVTPICPNDPYANMGVDLEQADGMITDASGTLEWPDRRAPRGSERDVSMNNPSLMSNTYLNLSYPTLQADPAPANADPVDTKPKEAAPSTGPVTAQPSEVKTDSNQFMLNPQPSKCKEEDPKPTCPPCPACERCPEPQVDCKRVVKYKDQQYPVPVIADFSHFSRY